MLKVKQAIVSV